MLTPTLARKVYELNKTALTSSIGTTKHVLSVVADGVGTATAAAREAGATVVGQTRSAVDRTTDEAVRGAKEVGVQTRSAIDRTADQARVGVKEVAGQAKAQGRRASERVDAVATRTADRAIDAVSDSPSSGTPYESWSKEELYERARELDVDGRSTMNKKQLIAALRTR